MAKLIPGLIVIFCFSVLLSSSHAGSPVTAPEDDATVLPTAAFNEEDVSDLKSLIVLPTDKPKEIEAVNQPGSGNFFEEIHVKDIPMMNLFEEGEKKPEEFRPTANWRPVNHRMHPIKCRFRRFGGGDKIRPQNMPIWKEDFDGEHHHHHHHEGKDGEHHRHHHGEDFPARFPDVDAEGRMIGEFKEPHFFFRHHHHHHHHHHDHDDEDQFHHGEEDEMEEREHHRHRRGHGFWKSFRKFLGNF